LPDWIGSNIRMLETVALELSHSCCIWLG
jgi:hypothetical protein